MSHPKVIIGVDPGTQTTGFGIISVSHSTFELIAFGCIRTPASWPLPQRYKKIFLELSALLKQHHPEALAVETQFVEKNISSAIKLGMARGVILLASTLLEIPTFEYAPTLAKKAITGSGAASKEQIQRMVRSLLGCHQEPLPEDAADALAIAICHANHSRIKTPAVYESQLR